MDVAPIVETIAIESRENPLYAAFVSIYSSSFPVYEQRTERQQDAAFSHSEYRLIAYLSEERLIGFIACWEFSTYVYIEHFAVHPLFRGGGCGSRILRQFVAERPKMVLLEIDPVMDEVSAARLRFYQKCGFVSNDYPHIHPPYLNDHQGHLLVVLSTDRTINKTEYDRFCRDLCDRVMKDADAAPSFSCINKKSAVKTTL